MAYEDIKKFRKARKQLMLDGFGCKCNICGYDKCNEALEFHHLDPSKKEITLCETLNMKWDIVKEELKKCICVCANCHREIHQGLIDIDANKMYFNDKLVEGYDPEHKSEKYYDKCPICGKDKLITKQYCSTSCACKAHQKVDWSKIDLITLIDKEHKSISSIAKRLNVSFQAVKKHYIRLKNNLTSK